MSFWGIPLLVFYFYLPSGAKPGEGRQKFTLFTEIPGSRAALSVKGRKDISTMQCCILLSVISLSFIFLSSVVHAVVMSSFEQYETTPQRKKTSNANQFDSNEDIPRD